MKVNKDIKHRDKTIRCYIISRNWDKNPEFLLVREVVQNLKTRRPELSEFKYIYDYEWEVEPGLSDKGKGDLIFTDGNNNFLVVECKNKHSQEVRQQTLKYMKLLKRIYENAKSIKGLAVTPERWDLAPNEMSYWDIELSEKEKPYYELFDDIDDPNEIKLRNKIREGYKGLGLIPNNPINSLKELEDQGLIEIHDKGTKNDTSPFYYEVWIKTFENFPKEKYYGKGQWLKKTEAKAIAYADICNQLYLPYHMKDWRIPIKHQDIKELIFKTSKKDT